VVETETVRITLETLLYGDRLPFSLSIYSFALRIQQISAASHTNDCSSHFSNIFAAVPSVWRRDFLYKVM
jgi:hypothetical protein